MSELNDLSPKFAFSHGFYDEPIVRSMCEMDFAYRHAAAAYFKYGHVSSILLYLKVRYAAYSGGFSDTDVSDKRDGVLSPQDEVCGVL